METKIVAGYKVTTFRKYNTKLVFSLREKAIELLHQGKSLEEIDDELRAILKSRKKPTSTYISYWGLSDWNEKELLSIRCSSGDYTFVSITRIDK